MTADTPVPCQPEAVPERPEGTPDSTWNRKILNRELAALNAAVAQALAARTKWMDDHMAAYARFKVGDVLYDLNTGDRLGPVTRLYRYWQGRQSPHLDDQMSIEYEYSAGSAGGHAIYIDNTSRHAGALRIGTLQDLQQDLDTRARLARYTLPDGTTDWAALAAEKP